MGWLSGKSNLDEFPVLYLYGKIIANAKRCQPKPLKITRSFDLNVNALLSTPVYV